MGQSGELHPVQDAFIEHTGFQCSYCTPGFILATKALLDEQPDVDLDSARSYLGGNLCRCGSYVKILDAVLDARDRVAHLGDEKHHSSSTSGDAEARPAG